MDTNALIDSLVGTYRELNMKFRNMDYNEEVRSIVRRMRDDEIAFSQALKDNLNGFGTDDGQPAEIVGDDSTIAPLISQFGSARATTLNLLKTITDSDAWTRQLEDSSTIESHVKELVESDKNQLSKLARIAGA